LHSEGAFSGGIPRDPAQQPGRGGVFLADIRQTTENAAMTAESVSIPAEALLRHRAFVRALARSLVRDEHAAEDLVQETWLTALKRPPRSATALPAWLARVVRTRAQNAARGEARRVSRETAAARQEADESGEQLREHLAMQQKVVQAVLELKEPYRAVVLLRYYQGLSPAEIAARRGVPEGTARAQVSRAHDLLRERLDADFGGSRKAWSAGLLLLLGKPKSILSGAKVAIAAGLLFAAVVVPVAWYGIALRTSEPIRAPTLVAAESPAEPAEAVVLEASGPESEPPPPVRTAVALPQAPAAAQPTEADLAKVSVDDSLVLARQVQLELQKKLLVPDTNVPEVRAALEREPGLQLARVVQRGRFDGDMDGRFLGIRGAGAYFSFVTRSNSYDRSPDIELQVRFSTSFYGGTTGFMVDLGDVALADLVDSQARRPAGSALPAAVWDLLWTDAKTTGREFDRAIQDRAGELNLESSASALVDHTYLVRAILPGEHDVLAAFRTLSKDEYGYTFSWRILHAWPVPAEANWARQDEVVAPPAPPWLANLDVPALMDLSHRIRATSAAKLFPPRPDLEQKYPSAGGDNAAGVARMLPRGRFDAIVDGRERGAYYSFATRSNDFDQEQDLAFEQGQFQPSARSGLLIPLGKVDLAAVARAGESGLAGLEGNRLEAWKLLWTVNHDQSEFGRGFSRQDETRIRELNLPYSAPAVLGHSYLLRTIEPDKHDFVVAFTVVDKDDYGVWIAWRVLKSR
jgi:RNA polymerase sigma-70 factor (ECF subfamily)